jgi:hypothetical protein
MAHSSTPSAWAPWTAAFQQRLRELGWIEGRSIAIEYRWAEGRNERGAEIAAPHLTRRSRVPLRCFPADNQRIAGLI